jgi:hypothetical protein
MHFTLATTNLYKNIWEWKKCILRLGLKKWSISSSHAIENYCWNISNISWPVWVGPLTWLGATGDLKKDTKTDREKLGRVGLIFLMRDASLLCFQAHLFIQHVWESGVKCRLSSHGSSCIGSRNREAVMCCYLVQTILTRSVCPVFLARQPCWTLPPLGWVHACQPRGLRHSHTHAKALLPLPQNPTLT